MNWAVIFEPQNLALFGTGIVTTLTLLLSSLAVGAVMALAFALALTGPGRRCAGWSAPTPTSSGARPC